MAVQCVTCENFRLQGSELARHGFGRCSLGTKWQAESATIDRDCALHVPDSDADRVAKRRAWIADKDRGLRAAVGQG